jgi:hypothetical protein
MNEILVIALCIYIPVVLVMLVLSDRKVRALQEEIDFLDFELEETEGFNFDAWDRDGDGIVQEGTKWERKIN